MIKKLWQKPIEIDKVLGGFSQEYHVQNSKKLRKEYRPWKNILTKEEKKALKKYRMGSYTLLRRNINAYLGSGCLNDKIKNEYVAILDGALSNARLKENIATYRTITRKEYEFMRRYKINDEFVNREFKGTRATHRICKDNSAAYVIYLIPKGYECAYINYWIFVFMFEKELLIKRESKCSVVGIEKVFDKDCYILKVTN